MVALFYHGIDSEKYLFKQLNAECPYKTFFSFGEKSSIFTHRKKGEAYLLSLTSPFLPILIELFEMLLFYDYFATLQDVKTFVNLVNATTIKSKVLLFTLHSLFHNLDERRVIPNDTHFVRQIR